MKKTVALLGLFVAGCAPPDPFIGSYSFTITAGQDNQTAPSASTSTPTGTGTLVITEGKTDDYLVTLAHSDVGGCTLKGKRREKDQFNFDLAANQNCVLKNSSTSVNAVITTGVVAVTVTQVSDTVRNRNISLPISYSYSGTTIFGIQFAGTGSRTYAGPDL